MGLMLMMDWRRFLEDKMNVNNEDMIHRNDWNQFERLVNLIIVQ